YGSEMYAQPKDIVLLIAGVIPLAIIVLMQCASGKRTKKINLSNTKSKVTQSSASSNKSVKESNKLQKNKLRRSVEESSRLSSQKKER
ncbi:hypothetical protein WUBG_04489, partial [Wuchereria bancrofti]